MNVVENDMPLSENVQTEGLTMHIHRSHTVVRCAASFVWLCCLIGSAFGSGPTHSNKPQELDVNISALEACESVSYDASARLYTTVDSKILGVPGKVEARVVINCEGMDGSKSFSVDGAVDFGSGEPTHFSLSHRFGISDAHSASSRPACAIMRGFFGHRLLIDDWASHLPQSISEIHILEPRIFDGDNCVGISLRGVGIAGDPVWLDVYMSSQDSLARYAVLRRANIKDPGRVVVWEISFSNVVIVPRSAEHDGPNVGSHVRE